MAKRQAPRSEATRARLLSSAAEAFATKGFHATSTRDIAAGASISPTAMYAHHASKEELLYLLSHAAHAKAVEVVREAVASSQEPREQLRRLVHDFAIHHAMTHVESRVANYELNFLSDAHREEIRTMRREITQTFHDVITAGIERGDFAVTHQRLAASALISQCVDISRWFESSGTPPEQIAEAYADMAVRSVTTPR